MMRVAENRRGRAALDDFAVLHHADEIADLCRHTQVVRSDDDGEVEPLAQLGEELQRRGAP